MALRRARAMRKRTMGPSSRSASHTLSTDDKGSTLTYAHMNHCLKIRTAIKKKRKKKKLGREKRRRRSGKSVWRTR